MDKYERNLIGPKIKYFRKKLGISQSIIADMLNEKGINVDRTIISKMENQSREIYDYEIVAIAEILEVSILELFTDFKDCSV